MIDEQLAHLADEADDKAMRAMVAETPMASFEYRDARSHADAMAKHRAHIVASIVELEQRQDQLLRPMIGVASLSEPALGLRADVLEWPLARKRPRPRARKDRSMIERCNEATPPARRVPS